MKIRITMLALVAVLSLTACAPGVPILGRDPDWRTSTEPLDHDGLVWAIGSTVHLADGTTVETGEDIDSYLVAGDGVFFVPSDDDDDDDWNTSFGDAELFYVAPGIEAVTTGMSVDSWGISVSPDGSRLAILDADDENGDAVMRIFDLRTGDETTSDDGWDTSGIDDPEWYFNESEVRILAITDSHVYARTIDGEYAYDLDTGEGKPLDDVEEVPGFGDALRQAPGSDWVIDDTKGLQDTVFSASQDKRVAPVPPAGRPYLAFWLDSDTLIGASVEGPGSVNEIDTDDSLTLMTCEIPAGTCTKIPGTTDEPIIFPMKEYGSFVLDLGHREEQ